VIGFIKSKNFWIPACAGMTLKVMRSILVPSESDELNSRFVIPAQAGIQRNDPFYAKKLIAIPAQAIDPVGCF